MCSLLSRLCWYSMSNNPFLLILFWWVGFIFVEIIYYIIKEFNLILLIFILDYVNLSKVTPWGLQSANKLKWLMWHWCYFKEVSCSPGQTPIPHCILPIQSILDVTSGMVKDPPDVLDRQKCLDALAALRHAKWFQVRNIILLFSCSLMRE